MLFLLFCPHPPPFPPERGCSQPSVDSDSAPGGQCGPPKPFATRRPPCGTLPCPGMLQALSAPRGLPQERLTVGWLHVQAALLSA